MKYLKIETDEELEALTWGLAFLAASAHVDGRRSRLSARLHDRLAATPESRNGDLVFVEDANYLPSAPARCPVCAQPCELRDGKLIDHGNAGRTCEGSGLWPA